MIYDIVISDQAEIDLRGIFEYIAFELQAPENASGQLDRLEACIMDLDHMPKRYRQYELEPWKSRGLRVAPVDNYLVLYIPDDDTQVVIYKDLCMPNCMIATLSIFIAFP